VRATVRSLEDPGPMVPFEHVTTKLSDHLRAQRDDFARYLDSLTETAETH
jgi:hypothetical protein